MNLDEDLPPELVEAETGPEEEKLIKVPITIVTGKSTLCSIKNKNTYTICRLPWSRKNYLTQLHLNCPAWEENSSHNERIR